MTTALPILLAVFMAATLAVLLVGILSFGFGGRLSREHGTRLMTLRVIFQGIAIALFGLLVALSTL